MTRPLALVPATSYPAIVGAVLVHLRECRGLTQAEVAERIAVAASTYSRIENAGQALSVVQIRHLARVLECRPAEILDRADRVEEALLARGVTVRTSPLGVSVQAWQEGLVALSADALAEVVRSKETLPR